MVVELVLVVLLVLLLVLLVVLVLLVLLVEDVELDVVISININKDNKLLMLKNKNVFFNCFVSNK